jgi:hypothetical protein
MVKGVRCVLIVAFLLSALAEKEKVAFAGLISYVPEGFRMSSLTITEADAKADFMQRGRAVDIAVKVNSSGSKTIVLARNILVVRVYHVWGWNHVSGTSQLQPWATVLMTPEQSDAFFMSAFLSFDQPRFIFTPTSPLFLPFQVIEKHGCRCLFDEVGLKHVEDDFCQIKWSGLNCL